MSKNHFTDKQGRKYSVVYASANEIEKYDDLAVEFFDKILDMDYRSCFISDRSSLCHLRGSFEHDGVDKETIEKVKEIFHTDISDIEDGNFVEIFNRIANLRVGNIIM
ncbi:MAG: hypothetical protein WCY24_07635 [Lutispora sp.]|nr:hypothetical protein [Lutispora sp.]